MHGWVGLIECNKFQVLNLCSVTILFIYTMKGVFEEKMLIEKLVVEIVIKYVYVEKIMELLKFECSIFQLIISINNFSF